MIKFLMINDKFLTNKNSKIFQQFMGTMGTGAKTGMINFYRKVRKVRKVFFND